MRSKHMLAWMALLLAGITQAQAQVQTQTKPDSEYYLTKVTLTWVNGLVVTPLPPHALGRFLGDKITIELNPLSGSTAKTFHMPNYVNPKGVILPDSSETLNLVTAPGSKIQSSSNSLTNYRQGLKLRIKYVGAIPTNAWALTGATLAMEFRDSANNLHPQQGLVTVKFPINQMVRLGFNAGDSAVSAAKHRDTLYLSTFMNFKPENFKIATN